MGQFFTIEREVGNIAVVIFNRNDKDMNILSEAVCRELAQVLEEVESDSSVQGLVFISGKDDHFIVGADIQDIQSFSTAEDAKQGAKALQTLFGRFAKMKIPTVAAIHGTCLGGGLELSLACTWRVVTEDAKTKLGLPEIQLGLIPGAGGTQRLPRLVGIQVALDLILTGRRVQGRKATKIGLADACVPKHLLREQAVKFAQKKKRTQSTISDLDPMKLGKDLPKWATEGNLLGRRVMAKKAKEMVDAKTKGFYPASYKALEAVFDGFDLSLEKGLDLEAELFGQLVLTRESQSLTHLFHATTAIKKHPYKGASKEHFGVDHESEVIGVVGAGFMGAGIATVAADRGIRVLLSDPSKESVGRCMRHAATYFQKKLERRKLKPFEFDQRLAHISPDLSPIGFERADIVIEAVFEDLGLKQKILAGLEETAGDNFIFATNTSAIPISDIASTAKRPDRVIGMHFFSPVEKMPLLEIVITDKTAPWVIDRCADLGVKFGKQVVIVKDGPGFYTTRALAFYLAEASRLLTEGASIEQVDKALTDFGFPVGPITLIDEVGIDVGIHVLETIERAFPDRIEAPKGLQGIADSGRLGRKNNKGFYTYANDKKGHPDNAIYDLIEVKKRGDSITSDEIVDRCILLFVNECVRCLEDGILTNAYDGDVGAVFGLGFPPFWGGPFKYVDHLGAKTVAGRLLELKEKYGSRFQPANLLVEYAEKNQVFFPDEPKL